MQPCDALTLKAVLQEAKPTLLKSRVDKVQQTGRDEVVLSLRSRQSMTHFLLSAHVSYGRLCLINQPSVQVGSNVSGFLLALRKHLTGATIIGIEQMPGERVVDVIFSSLDEVGGASIKILTAEIMGRHSNLILWDKETQTIIAASHGVTSEMSRYREVNPGLRYVRPPKQERLNVFLVSSAQFAQELEKYESSKLETMTSLENWLLQTFNGLGRHLAQELVAASGELNDQDADLWAKVAILQEITAFKPAMKIDLSRHSALSWWPDCNDSSLWKNFPSVNDLVEEYFRCQETRQRFQQSQARLGSEIKAQLEHLETRLKVAASHMDSGHEFNQYKKFGDLILSHVHEIKPGQAKLICQDFYVPGDLSAEIPLNPNLTAAQNAQNYYRQFAKARARQSAVAAVEGEATQRLEILKKLLESTVQAHEIQDLEDLREALLGPVHQLQTRQIQSNATAKRPQGKPGSRLLSLTSSDGWTIYVGRNRQENDQLVSKMAQPHDIWMHIQGHGGAHVLIKVPSTKQDPPASTLQEAAQVAARLSKAASGGKVRVVYTYCRHVRKLGKDKPGMVRYENERTLEVDTATPMPYVLKSLFSQRAGTRR